MVILDTNIIIEHLRSGLNSGSKLVDIVNEKGINELAISIVTVQELYQGGSSKNNQSEEAMLMSISGLKVLDYSYEVAKQAGCIVRDMKDTYITFADAIIAASAITYDAQLYTLNVKDFAGIKGLELYLV